MELSPNSGIFIDQYNLNQVIARSKGRDRNGRLIDWKAFSKNMLVKVYGEYLNRFTSRGGGTKFAVNDRFKAALLGKIDSLYHCLMI